MIEKTIDAYSDRPVKCLCCLSEHEASFLCRAGKDKKYVQYQCSQCGFQFTWPCPSAEEINRFYSSEEYYSQTGESDHSDPGNYTDYDDAIKYTLDFFRGWLKSFALPEKSTMLDVGCALGRFMELARKDFGLDCTGVELSDYARNYVQEYYNGSFPVWKTLDDLPIPKKTFDLILLFDVIEHVNDPWKLLLGLFRRGCIGENTRILITTPNCVYKEARKDPGAWKYRYPPAHLSFCAPETFQKIAEVLLFTKVDITGHSFRVDEGSLSIADMLQETFRDYEGLVCCFAGSTLGKISAEKFPASLEELKKSGEYLVLLSEFVLGKQNKPFNPLFRSWLADFCQKMTAENDRLSKMYSRLERNSYSLWLKIIDLSSQTEQMTTKNQHLENQLHELSKYKDHLENQVREISGYKNHLENQVREFSAKLNEVYHSRSYRISRMITWPLRKCKDAAVSVFGKSCRLSEMQASRPYDVISSLGANCEVSFNFNRIFGFVDSYPLIWAFVHTLGHLPELIEDPMILASNLKMEHNYEHNMVRFPDIDVSFHCKGLPGDLLGPDGKVDEKKAQAERTELKSRLAYLARKWKDLLNDPSRTVLFVLSPWEEKSTTKEILAVHKALRKYPGVDLLAVLTGKEKKVSASKLRSKGIFVRYITRHPPHNQVTDLQANDIAGWNRIFQEFTPLNKKTSNKVFKYEK